MQITILSVAAKPQQFFKGKKKLKKKIRIIVQSQISELRSQWGKSTYVGPCGFWNPGEKSPPARNQEEKAFWEEKRGGCRNAEHTVWVYDVLSSGSKAPVGPRLPRRGFMTGSCFLCWTFSQRAGERTSWCHLVEWRGLLCSLSPCKVPCQRVLLQSRQAEGVRVSSRRFIAGRLGTTWAHVPLSLTLGRQSGWGTSPLLRPCLALMPQGPLGHTAYKAAAGRWRNSCDKKLETDIIIVHSQQHPGSCKLLNLSVSRCYREIHHCFVCFYFPCQLAM